MWWIRRRLVYMIMRGLQGPDEGRCCRPCKDLEWYPRYGVQLLGGPDPWPAERQCDSAADLGEADVPERISGFPFLELVSLRRDMAGGTRWAVAPPFIVKFKDGTFILQKCQSFCCVSEINFNSLSIVYVVPTPWHWDVGQGAFWHNSDKTHTQMTNDHKCKYEPTNYLHVYVDINEEWETWYIVFIYFFLLYLGGYLFPPPLVARITIKLHSLGQRPLWC